MICMIQAICSKTTNQIGSRSFKSTAGVRQGCALSSTLFDIYVDDVDNIWTTKGIGRTVLGGVSEFKYLGYWFTAGGTFKKHTRWLVGKTQQTLNSTWGLI
ncbi:Protein of unknown function [Cotesia congregata]|uniref:Reverse transcriptase domain-containing protein n=1 Tax=Cotesia congregata TaxID=51543 RepID=A0A8J2HID2_COTCN|nr:Protein of unknown function [Cotesia congregata]